LGDACVLLSGGKDSNYALWRAVTEGLKVGCVATVRPARRDSWMFHYPLADIVRLQVSLAGLSDVHHEIRVSGEKEVEVNELLAGLKEVVKNDDFEYLVIGGIASLYQKKRFEYVAKELGLKLYSPQWGKDPSSYLLELVESEFEFIITEAKVYGLDRRFVGVVVTKELAEEIVRRSKRFGFNPAFEGGEAETLVLYQPLFRDRRICLEGVRRSLSEFEHVLEVYRAWTDSREKSCLVIRDEA
jgi:ABC transporter with metal-binding/Fe-S-binding domain ATP-binding protein